MENVIFALREKSELKNGDGEKVTGFSYHQLDNDTLAMFLFFLNNVYHATATFHGQILPLYIQGINHKNVLAFSD